MFGRLSLIIVFTPFNNLISSHECIFVHPAIVPRGPSIPFNKYLFFAIGQCSLIYNSLNVEETIFKGVPLALNLVIFAGVLILVALLVHSFLYYAFLGDLHLGFNSNSREYKGHYSEGLIIYYYK